MDTKKIIVENIILLFFVQNHTVLKVDQLLSSTQTSNLIQLNKGLKRYNDICIEYEITQF